MAPCGRNHYVRGAGRPTPRPPTTISQGRTPEPMSPRAVLSFPRVSRVQLRAFSLFALQPDLDIDVPPRVFCLAGANGLGKSTFLSAVNYGLTGFVPDPGKTFLSSTEYFEHHRHKANYSEDFFSGRIAEEDREEAAITLSIEIGGARARITRGVFAPSGLREFTRSGTPPEESRTADSDEDGTAIEREFQRWVTEAVGLDRFAQYAFLQHMVLTFDESRHLLLWDRVALNEALLLAIGTDPKRAARATRLRREMDKAGSRARNVQFHINNVTQRITTIREELGRDSDDDDEAAAADIHAQYEALEEVVRVQRQKRDRKQKELKDAILAREKASAKISGLRDDYNREFSQQFQEHAQIALHPTVAASLSENECAVCGTAEVAPAVQLCLDQNACPLCRTALPESPGPADLGALQRIDRALARANAQLELATAAGKRLAGEKKAAADRLAALEAELKQFEAAHRGTLVVAVAGGPDSVAASLARLRDEQKTLVAQKKQHYAERDKKRRDLVRLQNEFKKEYSLAEADFVPRFQALARSFLGVDLLVRPVVSEAITTLGFSLEVEMKGSARRDDFQLSESQRFFLDIALRMALAQYMCSDDRGGSLYVDTPEGSLDIAYEARAGRMFADFTASGHSLVMTANINTSQLLLELATACRAEGMTLHRMTSWTELSDVQLSEEVLFEKAYDAIEKALVS